ncbi:MAG: LuxR C-terminal-related transcriptional regulator [Oscillospiraceae bacterium]
MAELWSVSTRTVQKWASGGHLKGAYKLGRDWIIPENAEKPSHTKGEQSNSEPPQEKKSFALPLMNASFPPGKALDYINTLEGTECHSLALAEYHYYCGNSQNASCYAAPLLGSKDIDIHLSALLVHSFANIELGEIGTVRHNFSQLQGLAKCKSSSKKNAVATFIMSMTAVLLHRPTAQPIPLESSVKYLPEGMKLYSLYALAHLWYLNGEYGRSMGIAESGLAMSELTYPIPFIYLNLIAAIDCINLQQIERAKSYFTSAWTLAQKDKFFHPFAEHHGLLGGLVEVMLKGSYPAECEKIIKATYSFSKGWRQIHNANTDNAITDVLTTTEFTIAMLASKKWSNQQIAEHMKCSASTIKTHLSSIYRKLNIADRGELKQFLLE